MPPTRYTTGGRISGLLALGFFIVYLANVLQGKARLLFDWQPLFQVDAVVEFLLLALSAACFTVTILRREAQDPIPDRPYPEEESPHEPEH